MHHISDSHLKNIITNIHLDKNDKKYLEVFKGLKPLIITKIQDVLISRRIKQTGRPITTNFDRFLDALFFLCDSGAQSHYVKEHYGISKGTFYRYLKLITEYHILEDLYHEIIKNIPIVEPLITDTFTVKSMRGNDGLGRNPTDRGRKGLKVSIICDTNRVSRTVHIGGANTHDSKMLINTIDSFPIQKRPIKCLCDAGYVGKQLAIDCMDKNLRLIVKPKKVGKKGKISHHIDLIDQDMLKKHRNQIELLNGNIRRFRGLMIKWVTTITSYRCFLYVSLLSIACYQYLMIR